VAGTAGFEELLDRGEATVVGDAALPAGLFGMLDVFQPMFPVVTPV
jgi:alkyl sulfatase BDS1-like metallo-beta-lactamase superfamily hydrolase